MAGVRLPNIPQPKNGSMKLYDNPERTFSDLWSAKTIYFYKNNDEYFEGVRVPVCKAKYRTMDSLMDDLSSKVPLYFGVRRLFTPVGGREIQSLEELRHLGRYVCSSTKWAHKSMDLSRVGKGPMIRRTQSHDEARTVSESGAVNRQQVQNVRAKVSTAPTRTSQPVKHVLFLLNGKASRVYRMQLKLKRLPQFEDLLKEVSEGLQIQVSKLFTMDGSKILSVEDIVNSTSNLIACHKFERPILDNAASKLPPIPPMHNARRRVFASSSQNITQLPEIAQSGQSIDKIKKNVRRRTLSNKNRRKKPKKEDPLEIENKPPDGTLLEKFAYEDAAIRMQRAFRAHRMWKKFVEKMKIVRRIGDIDADLANRSAVIIQSNYRRFNQRRKFQKMVNAKRHIDTIDRDTAEKAAIRIQSLYRGYKVRKAYKRPRTAVKNWTPDLINNEDEFAKQENAAIKLQAAFRGYVQMKKYKKTLAAKKFLDTLDPEKALKAALMVQKWYRGFKARKRFKELKKQKHIDDESYTAADLKAIIKIQSWFRRYQARNRYRQLKLEKQLLFNGIDPEAAMNAAVKIQSVFRGFKARKLLKGRLERDQATSVDNVHSKKSKNQVTYNISVFTGNRWGADSDCNLYIILCGDQQSEKFVLREEKAPKNFLQNEIDVFAFKTTKVVHFNKIIVGHDSIGYGSGIFINEIIVSEENNKSYVFPCMMWLDSGQVDGKIERALTCKGYLENGAAKNHRPRSKPSDVMKLKITMQIGEITSKSVEGVASVYIVCYGTETQSDPQCLIDMLTDSYANKIHSFEVLCDNVPDMYKIRIESRNVEDGNHHSTLNWYLGHVDLTIVRDTGSTMRLFCDSWLNETQPFRELAIIRNTAELLPINSYQVSLKTTNNAYSYVVVQLHGEMGDSGPCTVHMSKNDENIMDTEVTFNIECVHLGQLSSVFCAVPVDEHFESISEGLSVISSMFDKYNLPSFHSRPWLVEKVTVRESPHAPYQCTFANPSSISSNLIGHACVQLALSEMIGISTKAKRKKSSNAVFLWFMWISTGQFSFNSKTCTPILTVYGEKGKSKPIVLASKEQNISPNSVCKFKLEMPNIGTIYKIRIQLNYPEKQDPRWFIEKIKMKEQSTGDELRFAVQKLLEKSSYNSELIVELPAIWPDISPLPSIIYQLSLNTGVQSPNSVDMAISVVVVGDKGDSGKRTLSQAVGTQSSSSFKPGNVDTFELELVSVRSVKSITITCETKKKNVAWFLDNATLYDPETQTLYKFEAKKWFSDVKHDKRLERTFTPTETIENVTSS